MACNDRQLTEAQRQAGYDQQRTGVVRAIRPFSGPQTIENLIDYVNRELGPAVRASRDKVNEVFKQVADNAPSANPLAYYFAVATANADPTVGRMRLNQAVQNTATIIRVSQSNGRLQDVTPWLDVMSGGPTAPLGVLTMVDAINPGRFLRFDLNTMTDQGAYWDLGVTIVESSTAEPFVEGEPIVIGFIAGVSAAGSTIPVGALSPVARDTFVGNIGTTTAAPVAVPLASIDSTSIVYDATAHEFRRAAVTGAVSVAANVNASLFAGIRDNGTGETARTNLNFVTTNDIVLLGTQDAANDEIEISASLAAGTTQNEGTGGQVTVNAGVKVLAITTNITISGFARAVTGNVDGDRFWVRCNNGIECTLQQATGTAANQMSLPYAEDMIVPSRGMIEFRYEGSWRAISTGNKGRVIAVTAYTDTSPGTGTHDFLSDARSYFVEILSGQGGGGGANSAAAEVAVGGQGGWGARILLYVTTVPASVTYTMGGGGAGGASTGADGAAGTNTIWDGVTLAAGGGGRGSANATLGSGSGTTLGVTAGGAGGIGATGSLPTGATVVMFEPGAEGGMGVRMSGTTGWGGGVNASTGAPSNGQAFGALSSNNVDRAGASGANARILVWELS